MREVGVTVCAVDGVAVAETRSGAIVHVDEIPKGIDPEHEIVEVSLESFREQRGGRGDLHAAVADLLLHHATLHPLAECEWAARVSTSLRASR